MRHAPCMARVRRIDLGALAAPVRRADGTLVAEARLTRTGVFTYRNADGTTRREYRPASQVFDTNSLASFKMVPVTDDHPPEMITSANAKRYTVGTVGENVRQDGKWMVAPIVVYDASVIAKMDSGKTQVSNGYDCELDETPGISPDGEHYDAVQTNIVGNHLAIVHSARAGSAAAVRMDALYSDDGEAMDLNQALAALAVANEKLSVANARHDASDKTLAKLQAEQDSLKELLAKAETARKDAESATPARVKARVALETSASAVLRNDADLTVLADRDIKLAVIKHVTNADCSDKPDVYVDARYDAAIERAAESKDTFRVAHDMIEVSRADGTNTQSKATEKARQDMLDANRSGGRQSYAESKGS